MAVVQLFFIQEGSCSEWVGGSTSKETLQMYQDLHVSRNATSTVVGSFSKQEIVELE